MDYIRNKRKSLRSQERSTQSQKNVDKFFDSVKDNGGFKTKKFARNAAK